MYLFYSIMILLGVTCVSFSILLLIVDRRKVQDLSNDLDSKKEDIIEVINDAEQIVIEMNNFSDYLLERIDTKAKELEDRIENTQQYVKNDLQEEKKPKIQQNIANEVVEVEEAEAEVLKGLSVVNGSNLNSYNKQSISGKNFQEASKLHSNIDIKIEGTQIDLSEILYNGREKVIPINPKHRNVYTLFEKGYSEVEIAKTLKMGHGEIKLILGVKR